MPDVVVTPEDLVLSFCKMMKGRGIAVSVIYRYHMGGRSIMKMTGNQGPEGTQSMLALIAQQVKDGVAQIEADGTTVRPLSDVMQERERSHLQHALNVHGGKRNAMAADLGVSRKTLWEKLRAHGLSGDGAEAEPDDVAPDGGN